MASSACSLADAVPWACLKAALTEAQQRVLAGWRPSCPLLEHPTIASLMRVRAKARSADPRGAQRTPSAVHFENQHYRSAILLSIAFQDHCTRRTCLANIGIQWCTKRPQQLSFCGDFGLKPVHVVVFLALAIQHAQLSHANTLHIAESDCAAKGTSDWCQTALSGALQIHSNGPPGRAAPCWLSRSRRPRAAGSSRLMTPGALTVRFCTCRMAK